MGDGALCTKYSDTFPVCEYCPEEEEEKKKVNVQEKYERPSPAANYLPQDALCALQ